MFPIVVLILLAGIIAGSYYAYRKAFYSPARHPEPNEPLEGEQYAAAKEHIQRITGIMERIPFESVRIQSQDGLTLFGRYYHVSDGAPLEILFHGYRSHPFRDCAGGHALSRKMGFNALVVDQRAHGSSEGNTISFGILERLDALEWIKWANDRFGRNVPIILSGLSMGAATVLMTADLDLPENVACILADSPYSDPLAIIEKVAGDQHLPEKLCRPFIRLGARIFGGFHIGETSAEIAVRSSKVPILLIHGEDDRFVPCEMSRHIAKSAGCSAHLETFPGAGHGLSYITDPLHYEKTVFHFLRQIPSLASAIREEYIQQLFAE